MKLLITGGNGFAGRFLCKYFCDKGHEVTATYRSSKPAFLVESVKYVQQELSEKIIIDGEFDAIVHTACSQPNNYTKMETYIRDNIDSARQLVKFAEEKEINTIVYFSTRSVYGNIRCNEIYETSDIINPDKYGETKHVAEKIFHEAGSIQTIGFRLPGIIGPGAHDIWLVDVARRVANGETVEISDFYTKNLVDILDIAIFIEKLFDDVNQGKTFKYDLVNLACKESINNLEIVGILKEILNSDSEIVVKKPSPGLFLLNSEKAQEMGFVSSNPAEIVKRYANYYNSLNK